MAKKNDRLKQTARDMLISMAVLVVPLVLIVSFFPHDAKKQSSVATVDYSMDLTSARHAAPFTVLAPQGLPSGWRATADYYDSIIYGPDGASFVPGGVSGAPLRWEIGFLSPDNQYVALDQMTATPDKVLAIQAADAVPVTGDAGRVTVGGMTWHKYEGSKRRALVRTESGTGASAATQVSVVVSGSAPFDELQQFAALLRP
jgi:hypothetical protein